MTDADRKKLEDITDKVNWHQGLEYFSLEGNETEVPEEVQIDIQWLLSLVKEQDKEIYNCRLSSTASARGEQYARKRVRTLLELLKKTEAAFAEQEKEIERYRQSPDVTQTIEIDYQRRHRMWALKEAIWWMRHARYADRGETKQYNHAKKAEAGLAKAQERIKELEALFTEEEEK